MRNVVIATSDIAWNLEEMKFVTGGIGRDKQMKIATTKYYILLKR